jgi:hypothetical protein
VHRPRLIEILTAILLLFGWSLWHSVAAQTPDPYQFVTLDCVFSKNVVTSIENGKVETAAKADNFAMTFSGFNREKGEAMLIGNVGTDRVVYIPGDRKIMLIQITDTGNGSMTSISEPRNGEAIAFHSRHMWMGGNPIVSHYSAGRCKTRR